MLGDKEGGQGVYEGGDEGCYYGEGRGAWERAAPWGCEALTAPSVK